MGIGEAMAHRFAEAGSALHLVDIDDQGLRRVKEELTVYGVEVDTHRVDLSDYDQIMGLWEGLGDVDVLVNNAGIYPERDFLELDPGFLEKVLDVNLNQVLWMCQQFIKRSMDRGGVILNVGSIEALLPFKNDMTHYTVSKAGVIALTRGLARDYSRKGFRINVLIPGGIVTPGTMSMARDVSKMRLDLLKTGYDFRSRLPMARAGQPDEVATMALVMVTDASSYMTGALVAVDGGFLSA